MVKRAASSVVLLAACVAGCAGLLGVDDVSYLSGADAGGGPPDISQLPSATATADAAGPSTSDAPSVVTPDTPTSESAPDAALDAAATAACRKAACTAQGAECGAVPGTCGGEPVDCGPCAPGSYCGDNNHPGRCGYFCLDTGLANYCTGTPLPTARAFNYGCNAPYWVAGTTVVLRDAGIVDCANRQVSANLFLTCCP